MPVGVSDKSFATFFALSMKKRENLPLFGPLVSAGTSLELMLKTVSTRSSNLSECCGSRVKPLTKSDWSNFWKTGRVWRGRSFCSASCLSQRYQGATSFQSLVSIIRSPDVARSGRVQRRRDGGRRQPKARDVSGEGRRGCVDRHAGRRVDSHAGRGRHGHVAAAVEFDLTAVLVRELKFGTAVVEDELVPALHRDRHLRRPVRVVAFEKTPRTSLDEALVVGR